MKIIFLLFFVAINNSLLSQSLELKNKDLIQYYALVNKAENNIVKGDLNEADINYRETYNYIKNPPAKDLHNNMTILLKMKKYESAYKFYETLKCLQYNFDDSFFTTHFPDSIKYKNNACKFNLNSTYQKQLDSLFEKDQYYRNLSNGNYSKYKKEMSQSDSIVATTLLKLIKEKGFPNEYDLGLKSANKVFFQNFYFIIWHQLQSNLYYNQKVNFSAEINGALNEGKITPENAAFLFDLLNGNNDYTSKHFVINQFITSNGSDVPIYDQIKNNTANVDCCYVTYAFFPEKRNDSMKKMIINFDEKRKKIGLSSVDDDLKRKIFSLNNREYVFADTVIEGMNFENKTDSDFFKKHMFKIN